MIIVNNTMCGASDNIVFDSGDYNHDDDGDGDDVSNVAERMSTWTESEKLQLLKQNKSNNGTVRASVRDTASPAPGELASSQTTLQRSRPRGTSSELGGLSSNVPRMMLPTATGEPSQNCAV